MTDGELKNRIVEIYLTASELCGAGLAGLNSTNPVNEINNLVGPMSNQCLTPYTNNPVNMTDWNPQGLSMKEILCYNSKTGGFLIALERIFKHFQDREIQKSAFFY